MTWKVLDLFCGAGGSAVGLKRAWPDAEIIGVDIKPQKHYPFTFVLGDAMTFPLEGYDFIWASPPCQAYSTMTELSKFKRQIIAPHPELIDLTRIRLDAANARYCIENVYAARRRMKNRFVLCGSMFGLGVYRHRVFETTDFFLHPPEGNHKATYALPYFSCVVGIGGKWRGRNGSRKTDDWRKAMDIDWMDRYELTQAVPPAYSEFIARQIRPCPIQGAAGDGAAARSGQGAE